MKTGNIKIESLPSGVDIYINGVNQMKVTPCLIKNVPAGTHEMTLKLDGHEDKKEKIIITENETVDIHLRMEKPKKKEDLQPIKQQDIKSLQINEILNQIIQSNDELRAEIIKLHNKFSSFKNITLIGFTSLLVIIYIFYRKVRNE